MFSINKSRGRPFSAGACPVPEGNTICGETKTLDIINEFKRLYEEKMDEIDKSNCGDCLQEKMKLQQNWIGDLTEQNEMLVRAVEELEMEATDRVRMLEDKLQKSAECICEVMKKYRENDATDSILEEPRRRIFNLENDTKNLLELIRRICEGGEWNTGGLIFYEITERDIFGNNKEYLNSDLKKEKVKLKDQDSLIRSLEKKIIEMDGLSKELEAKREECESLQKDMIDMRQALTEEVAIKHDIILKLKRECQELEERCIQADKQTAFRDDIIQELRKEIKQLKQQENQCLRENGRKMVEKILDLASNLELVKYKIDSSLDQISARITLEERHKNDASKISDFDAFIKELNNIAGSTIRDNLYSFMEKEIIELNKIVEVKHNQLQELFELNKILICKLFNADNGLKLIEERALSTLVLCLENESSTFKSKNIELEEHSEVYEKEKEDLLEKVNDAQKTILALETQFNDFLQEKEHLKIKYKSAAKQGSCLLDECNKIKAENSLLKSEYEKLKKDFEACWEDKLEEKEHQMVKFKSTAKKESCLLDECNKTKAENSFLKSECEKLKNQFEACFEDKNLLENKINELEENFKNVIGNKDECICQNNQLSEENKKLVKELQRVHKMNEHLLSTIDGLRGQLNVTSRITSDEVTKLNKTIDVLRTTLEQGKVLHEEEERDTIAEINCLSNKIKEFESYISQLNKEIQDKNEDNSKLNTQIKELESLVCHWKKLAKEKENEISKLHKSFKDLESCMCGFKNQFQNKSAEITTLKNNIRELESCISGLQEQSKYQHDENSALNNRIQELERYIYDLEENSKSYENVGILNDKIRGLESSIVELQSKSKLCKICKQSIRVTFCGNCEVQTDVVQEPTDEQLELLVNRDELIRYQSSTLEKMQQELQCLCEREKELLTQTEISYNERTLLQNKILILERKLSDAQKIADLLTNKEEIIKKQKEALNLLQKEAESWRAKETEMRSENDQCCTCIQQLKNKINELETTVQNSEMRANNLQMAVDLYTNTINVLEASEEKYKLEIDHQRSTINHLQDVLVTTKHELDEYKHKYDDSVKDKAMILNKFIQVMAENEKAKKLLEDQIFIINEKYETMQELNFNVEVEHCNSLQDVEKLDNQLFKYRSILKTTEDELKLCKNNLKKLLKQKKCFEEVIQYFKTEMMTMSQQLQNLQDLLNMSNETAQEETNKLIQAFANVQDLNHRLSIQLKAAEQKVILENQMNQLNEAKITELERIVNEKEIDLDRHTDTIQSIKNSLQSSLKQNEELQLMISSLNRTIVEFEDIVKQYEEDNKKSKENTALCQSQISLCRDKLLELNAILDQKTTDLSNLESAYTQQHTSLKSCQIELNKFKEKHKAKQLYLKNVIEQLKDQVSKSQEEKNQVLNELNSVQVQLSVVKTKDSAKEVEIKRYRRIVGDLKTTLNELNQTLSRKDFQLKVTNIHNESCQKYGEGIQESTDQSTNTSQDDICLNCPCEVEFYTGIVETLKKAIMELKKKHFGTQKKNQELEEELLQKELQVKEISKTQLEKDKEYNDLKQKLMNTLQNARMEEEHYAELTKKLEKEISLLKKELDHKSEQINELEMSSQEMNGSKGVQLAVAQDEVNRLKEQLNKLLKQKRAVNVENDKLHNQTELLQSKVTNMEESSNMLRSQIEQYLVELQIVQKEKESLHQKNQDLLYELRSLQTSYDAATNQQRYKDDAIKTLESKLNMVKTSRDEICLESKNALDYFRHWLQEQNRINKYIVVKERNYCKTIDMLKQQIQEAQFNPYAERVFPKTSTVHSPPTCQSPCSLGSQGNESIYGESPSRSPYPRPGEDSDWFSTNFKNDLETDLEEEDEDWVSKVENLAEQVKKTNKMWKRKMKKSDFAVTKDSKK